MTGTIGRAYGAPRLTVTTVTWLGTTIPPSPQPIRTAPGASLEWRLVQVTGRLDTVHKLGDRWRTEIIVGSIRIPIAGLAGSRIAVGRIFAGRQATIVGIVRRAFPTAIDQRFAIEPRSVSDVAFAAAGPSRSASTGASSGGGSQPVDPGYGPGVGPTSAVPAGSAVPVGPLVDLRELASYRGRVIQVGGLVTAVENTTISIDDGTASGRLILSGEAAVYLDLVEVGDPIVVDGLVELDSSGPYLFVTDPDGVVRTGDPDAPSLASATPSQAVASPAGAGLAAADPGPSSSGSVGGRAAGASGPSSIGLGPLEALGILLLGAAIALGLAGALAVPLVRRAGRPNGRAAGPALAAPDPGNDAP